MTWHGQVDKRVVKWPDTELIDTHNITTLTRHDIQKYNDTSVDPKQQYISRLSKTCVYKAGHGVSSCSLWSMPSEHGASSWGIIMGHLYRFMGHHHLEHEHAQANAACNNATSNCSSERPSHVVFHAAHYFGHYFGRFFHAGHQSIVTSMQPLRASSFGA